MAARAGRAKKPKEHRFAAWVRAYGVSKLTRDLGKKNHRGVVHNWLAKRYRPSHSAAIQMIELSKLSPINGKPLTYEEIYGYFISLPVASVAQASGQVAAHAAAAQ